VGRLSVDNPTLNRFFSLHYLLPFVIVGVVILHIWALHVPGKNNPTGIEVKSAKDTVPFTPYYDDEGRFALVLFLIVFRVVRVLHAELLGHADNYIRPTRW
jgi:quinol-cytochrome oxidoreductase complex cytochrome b subunit